MHPRPPASRGRSSLLLFPLFFALLLCIQAPVASGAEQAFTRKKTAVVLATFGSSVKQQKDPLAPMLAEMQKRRPDVDVFVAYTSKHVLAVLRDRGECARGLNQVLAELAAAGYGRVAVQAMHMTPGKEYDALRATADLYFHLPKFSMDTEIGRPLVGNHRDAEALAGTLTRTLPRERKPEDAIVFVGHGAENLVGSLAYPALQAFLWQQDAKIFVGTIEGPYDAESVRDAVLASRAKTVWLLPLLTIAGEHARNDIFGDEKDSWKTLFTQAGLTVKAVNQGLLALPEITTLFAGHAEAALNRLEERGRTVNDE